MSKIAKIPVIIKEGVKVTLNNNEIIVEGPKGNLKFIIPNGVKVDIAENEVKVSKTTDTENAKALSGLVRANIANMVTGVTEGFEKKLELTGVGYRAQANGNNITLNVGYAHPVNISADQSVTFKVEDNTIIIAGINKEIVGDTAAKVRNVRPPEPYKGKGIKYQNEHIRRKVGKAAKAVGAA